METLLVIDLFIIGSLQTYAEMDPTTAALEKEHEAVSITC